MVNIESYVFLDLETTGLPWQEKNRTKITEFSFVATSRQDIIKTKKGNLPPVSKLTFLFNPTKPIHPDVVKLNGLSNDFLKHAPLFKTKIDTIITFLKSLPKPVCLVAHNGYSFDFKILLAEFNDANSRLPDDIFCVDTLVGFRQILTNTKKKSIKSVTVQKKEAYNEDELITDDEDDWPCLNVSSEEWQDIDQICESLSDISCEDFSVLTNEVTAAKQKKITKDKVRHSQAIKKVINKDNEPKTSYSLIALYKRLLNKEACNAHRAEADCFMLLECVIMEKDRLLPWIDHFCKSVLEIKPLIRL